MRPESGKKNLYQTTNTLAGRRLNSNVEILHKKYSSEEEIFSAKYTTDEFGRRRASPWSKTKSKHAIFAGCSFTFGYGLNQKDTLPFLFGKSKNFNSYNYAVPSYGTYNILANLNERHLTSEIVESNGYMIYVYIEAHLRRSIGVDIWIKDFNNFPVYNFIEGKIKYQGNMGAVFPISSFFLEFISRMITFRKIGLLQNLLNDLRRTPKAHENWLNALVEIKRIYKQSFPKGHFIFLIHPGQRLPSNLRKGIIAKKIDILELNGIPGIGTSRSRIHKFDRHPSASLNKSISQLLISSLESDPGP